MAAADDPECALDFKAKTIDGETVDLENYEGKVVLIVNTASQCGLTPQYAGLQELYSKYKGKGMVVLGFPCNQFGSQEPGSEAEIKQFCSTKYSVSFPMFSKIEVNGDNAAPIYKYLTSKDVQNGNSTRIIRTLALRAGRLANNHATGYPSMMQDNVITSDMNNVRLKSLM